MSIFRKIFAERRVVLPVIHVESLAQARRNAAHAHDAGADGVFLISHGTMADEKLLAIHDAVAEAHPGWWTGVNCLGLTNEQVFSAISPKVRGVWTDNALIDERAEEQLAAFRVDEVRRSRAPACLYFGGVAFKYQRQVDDLAAACRIARQHLDVVTTSGPGTGKSASVEKIKQMKEALGDWPLAIASGITPENVGDYLPWADCFLVATGISRTFTELDVGKVRTLVEQAR